MCMNNWTDNVRDSALLKYLIANFVIANGYSVVEKGEKSIWLNETKV